MAVANKVQIRTKNSRTEVETDRTVMFTGTEHQSSASKDKKTITLWKACNPINRPAMINGALKSNVSRYEAVISPPELVFVSKK